MKNQKKIAAVLIATVFASASIVSNAKCSDQLPIGLEALDTNEQETEKEAWMSYDDYDVTMLGDLMYAEEGILLYELEYEEAKRACMLAGSVVLHRVMSEEFPDTIEDVIFSSGYAETTQVKIGSSEIGTPEEVYEWAEELLCDGPLGPDTLVFQAQFEQGTEVYEQIYNQYFCLM